MLTSIETGVRPMSPPNGAIKRLSGKTPSSLPGCGRTHWHIGRIMAECAFCSTALPLSDSYHLGAMSSFHRTRPPVVSANAA